MYQQYEDIEQSVANPGGPQPFRLLLAQGGKAARPREAGVETTNHPVSQGLWERDRNKDKNMTEHDIAFSQTLLTTDGNAYKQAND